MGIRGAPGGLLAQTKLLDQLLIFPCVLALQIVEQLAALTDQLQQTTARMMILHVGLEMIGQPVDSRSKQRDLYFR